MRVAVDRYRSSESASQLGSHSSEKQGKPRVVSATSKGYVDLVSDNLAFSTSTRYKEAAAYVNWRLITKSLSLVGVIECGRCVVV